MKRWTGFAVLAVAMWSDGAVAAQDVSGGVHLGVVSSTLVSDSAAAGHRAGFSAGAFLDLAPSRTVSLRAALLYATGGAPIGGSTLALEYLRLPVTLKVDLGGTSVRPVLFAGPSIGRKLSGELRGPAGATRLTNLRDWEVGWVAGAGVTVGVGGRRLWLDGRYARALTGVFREAGDKNQAISLSAGWYLF